MAKYDLTCKDCGGPHEVARKDAKYCPPCRLLRNLEWAVSKYKRARACRACGAKYRPFRPLNRDVATCGACMERRLAATALTQTCRLCGRPTAGTDGVEVCLRCVKDPDRQAKVIAALRKGQRERRAEHAEALAALRAGCPHLRRK